MPFWKKTSKGGKKKPPKSTVPRTAQQSIPMQRMFEDGTCRVKPNYYTRTIAYQDINYQLAQQEDKNSIFEEWCSFLNFFDSSIKFELSFVNMATDSTEFEKSIRIPFQKDGFDDVRAEYSQMLRQQLAKGNNGLTKTKFITFGVEGESMRQVKTRLELDTFNKAVRTLMKLNGSTAVDFSALDAEFSALQSGSAELRTKLETLQPDVSALKNIRKYIDMVLNKQQLSTPGGKPPEKESVLKQLEQLQQKKSNYKTISTTPNREESL